MSGPLPSPQSLIPPELQTPHVRAVEAAKQDAFKREHEILTARRARAVTDAEEFQRTDQVRSARRAATLAAIIALYPILRDVVPALIDWWVK